MAILQLVDQMTELLSEGREVPLSRYRMIDAEEFSQILERMRISVPSSIRESERTLVERDNILAQARKEADKIIQEARDIAADMLSDNSLVVMARQEAQRIIDDGHEVARQRTGEADGYATQVLQELHDKLTSISGQVENGITVMTQSNTDQSYADQSYADQNYAAPEEYDTTKFSHGYGSSGQSSVDSSSTLRRIDNPLTGRTTPSDQRSSSQDLGYSDTGYTDTGFSDSGFSDTGFSDTGFSDSGFNDTGFGDTGFNDTGYTNSGYSDRYQMNTSSSYGSEISPFDSPLSDQPQIDSRSVHDATSELRQADSKRVDSNPMPDIGIDSSRAGKFDAERFSADFTADTGQTDRPNRDDSPADSALQPPTLNYLSNPSDSMSEHL